jgi:hypothetical protein
MIVGGFGAQLRAMAKRKGNRATTDFGACRDLSGRRIRQVNDEQIMLKWKEAQDRGEEFNTEQRTQSGIDLWFLSTPSWAEGFGKKRKSRNMGRKTRLCNDWIRARENGSTAPPNAPSWWGCPRGRKCQFAHGEEELQGTAAVAIKEKQNREVSDLQAAYVEGAIGTSDDPGAVDDMIAAGLNAHKRKRDQATAASAESDTSEESDDEGSSEVPVAATFVQQSVLEFPEEWIHVLSGNATYSTGKLKGISEFSTVSLHRRDVVPKCEEGDWYFEVQIMTDGIIQVRNIRCFSCPHLVTCCFIV